MNGLVFVDTNVLLYSVDQTDPEKQERAKAWCDWLWKTRRGRLSFQVLQEFYFNVWRRWPVAKGTARLQIADLLSWKPLPADGELLHFAWRLQDRFGLSFWDSLIVAAAKASLCRILLSEDFQSGQNIDGLLVVDPFLTQPDQL
ncbi:MAG: PIN domain-containing protein [Candidatus Acidiferrum sp.]